MSTFIDAIKSGDAAEVNRLLDADPNLLRAADEKGVSAVLLAMYHGKRDIARLLIARGAYLSFHEACAAGETERAKEMLLADPDLLDRRSVDGYPPLGLAIFFGNRELAKFLIAQGADVAAAAENAQRVAPVHAASAVCDHEILAMLLDRGADPNARQQQGFTAMHTAASRGDIEMAKLLMSRGADATAKTDDGMSVADIARKYGHADFAAWIDHLPHSALGTRH